MRKFLLMAFTFLITAYGTWAQQVIKGKVSDEKGAPIPGANVNVKASATGTLTDTAGRFSFKIPSDTRILVVSALGYGVKEIQVNNETVFNISLSLEGESMNEVVVVAYGT